MIRRISGSTRAAVVLLVLAGLLAALRSRPSSNRLEYAPPPGTPEVSVHSVTTPAIGRVADLVIREHQLYVLDRFGARVVVADLSSDTIVAMFGRPGRGPGEFVQPSSLAVGPDGTIAVLDAAMVQFFTATGSLLGTQRPVYPCTPDEPHIAWAGDIYIGGSCLLAGTDTVSMMLWRLDARGQLAEVTRHASYSITGGWGSPFGARFALAESGSTVVFGNGREPCVSTVGPQRPIRRTCAAGEAPFSADPPPEYRRPDDPDRAMLLKWPEPMPWYVDRLAWGQSLLLLRPFRHDSLVARLVLPDGGTRDLFRASLDSFLRCRAGYCFWLGEHRTDSTVIHYAAIGPPGV